LLNAEPQVVELGSFPSNIECVVELDLLNPTDSSVSLSGSKVSCGCQRVTLDRTTIIKGEVARLSMHFKSGRSEVATYSVDLTDDAGDSVCTIQFRGRSDHMIAAAERKVIKSETVSNISIQSRFGVDLRCAIVEIVTGPVRLAGVHAGCEQIECSLELQSTAILERRNPVELIVRMPDGSETLIEVTLVDPSKIAIAPAMPHLLPAGDSGEYSLRFLLRCEPEIAASPQFFIVVSNGHRCQRIECAANCRKLTDESYLIDIRKSLPDFTEAFLQIESSEGVKLIESKCVGN
jgi:hypothetical protein